MNGLFRIMREQKNAPGTKFKQNLQKKRNCSK